MKFYVYALLDLRFGVATPFYIGKGSGSRARKHLAPFGKSKTINRLARSTIKRILADGYEYKVVIIQDGLAEDQAFLLEEKLIARYGRKISGGGLLTNFDIGGRGGAAGRVLSADTKKKMADYQRRRAAQGNSYRHTDEFKERMRKERPGAVKREKPVLKIDYEGIVTFAYKSLTDVASSLGMLIGNCRELVVKDGSMPRNGFFYRYEDSSDLVDGGVKNAAILIEKRNHFEKGPMRIHKIDSTNKLVETFNSVKDVLQNNKEYKCSSFYKAIKSGKEYDGFIWKIV